MLEAATPPAWRSSATFFRVHGEDRGRWGSDFKQVDGTVVIVTISAWTTSNGGGVMYLSSEKEALSKIMVDGRTLRVYSHPD